MAQCADTSIHSDPTTCSSFDSESGIGKSRTASTSSSVMDSEEMNTAASRTTQRSSTSSYSSCNDIGEELWNNFIFKPIQPEDQAKVLAHMRTSFYREEPLNAYVGYTEAKAEDMDVMIATYIKDGMSSIVLEKDTNKVAGARIIAIHRRHSCHSSFPLRSPEMKRIMPFLDKVDEAAAIFERYPDLEEYAELFMVSVHSEFRGQGLAGHMYRGAVGLLRSKGFKVMKSCFTSPFTRRIGEKMGFRELARAKFNEHLDENGKLAFPDAEDDEMAVIGVLEI